ncbi:glycosyltransferase [Lacrimispora sp. 38-1]|uniref:glycosyltransferase n=1 Tax=Lacrimispora sp. 38-1 TaxID=3125778 RepID=UPI003CE8F15A
MISVLMSVYNRENPEYLDKALASIYHQSLQPNEVVLVEDGPISTDLESIIKKYPTLKRVRLPVNLQLGRALQTGLCECRYKYVARMDSDDIAAPDRLKVQYEYLRNHPEISVVGGDIAEFAEEGKIKRVKRMPSTHGKLQEYGKLRNPLNHMTVMFKKDDIVQIGGYEHFPLLEDYHLWSRLLAAGYKIANIPKVLVWARIGENFANKRGGFKYFKQYKKLRYVQLKLGYTNIIEYTLGVLLSFAMTMQPAKMRNLVYRLLRRNIKE